MPLFSQTPERPETEANPTHRLWSQLGTRPGSEDSTKFRGMESEALKSGMAEDLTAQEQRASAGSQNVRCCRKDLGGGGHKVQDLPGNKECRSPGSLWGVDGESGVGHPSLPKPIERVEFWDKEKVCHYHVQKSMTCRSLANSD